MRARCLLIAFALLGVALAQPPAAQKEKPAVAEKKDVFAFSNGSVVVAYSDQYSEGYGALDALDGVPGSLWSSAENAPLPHALTIELPQTYRLDSVVLDNRGVQEEGYPGISVRGFELWGSTASATEGFRKLASGEAPQRGRFELAMPANATGRWMKLVITSNWGNAHYSEIDEIEAYGSPVGAPPLPPTITGKYSSNYGDLYLTSSGGRITGCYPSSSGTLSGATDGRMLNMQWRQGTRVGTVSMVLSADGALNGYWYENGLRRGVWYGKRIDGKPATCAERDDVGSLLRDTGRAILYGVHFDSDSAHLRADSEPTLQQALAALKAAPTVKVRIEGHTDSTNTDAYNLDLSKRRAQAVVAWLAAKGIAAERLSAEGLGKSKPVADNNSAQGRALNRRVEIAVVK